MVDENAERGPTPGPQGKVARLIDEYELPTVGEELEARWTADPKERASLRELADFFNKRLLEAVLQSSDVRMLDGDVNNIFRLLKGENVSSGKQTHARQHLQNAGIDVGALEEDFVSYQSIRTYLQNDREVSYNPAETDSLERDREYIKQLKGRMQTVIESKIEHRRESGDLSIQEFLVILEPTVICERCGRQSTVDTLINHGGCQCQIDT
ncbi:rod-determining factor RdfA [Halobacteriales archaeon Cl-PHB]